MRAGSENSPCPQGMPLELTRPLPQVVSPALTARSPSSTSNVTPLGRARAGGPGPLQAKKSLGSPWNWRQRSEPKKSQVGLGALLDRGWKGEGRGRETTGLDSKGTGRACTKGSPCLMPNPRASPSYLSSYLCSLPSCSYFLSLPSMTHTTIHHQLAVGYPVSDSGWNGD